MKVIKNYILACLLLLSAVVSAEEGMWLPLLLEKMNEKEMKSLGMKISAKDIYNINGGSLKDAMVSFGGFCTGEIISNQGLVLTNHHCGYDALQNHSTLEHNYLKDGFWSHNKGEEIPNKGLFVTFISRIEDVSKAVLNGVTNKLSESERQSVIDKNMAALRKSVKKESYEDSFIRAFFEGNQYYLFVTATYRDIRLVGAPPSAIGNFGQDSDNWVWPRHTGDFSMFRIYAGKDNLPADYSPDNIPYTPKKALNISLDGVKEGDFTLVFGFPGRTMEYLYSAAVDQTVRVSDPAKIAIRDKALTILDGFMRKDEQIKIQYAAKYAGISNSWKKWQGEILGLTKTKAVEKKKAYEAEFQKRVNANPAWKAAYGNLLSSLDAVYKEAEPYNLARDYFLEIISKIELFTIGNQLNSLITAYQKDGETGYQQKRTQVINSLDEFFGEYNVTVDQKLFESLMLLYTKDQPDQFVALYPKEAIKKMKGIEQLAEAIYGAEKMSNKNYLLTLLNQPAATVIETLESLEPLLLYNDMLRTYQSEVQAKTNTFNNTINQLQRTYMQAQLEVFKEKKFYPDANSTLRVSYGQVNGMAPRDAVTYKYDSHLEGVMEKYVPGDYEFDVPEKLRTLYKNKDYGQYGENNKMPVCFIATNHTTGGNSGSPALDAYGNLVGINFDRAWEGTMSDINYDPSICRNIMVDIRYVLFLIDKFAGAGHLVQEMKLVHPRKKG